MFHTIAKMQTVIMKSTLTHLTRVYLWPKTKKSSTKIAYLTLISGSFLLIGSIIRVVVIAINKSNASIVESVENIISQIGVMYFASFFILNREQVLNIVAELSDFEKFGKPPHFDRRNKQLDNIAKLFRFVLYSAIVGVFLWPAVYTKDCRESGVEVCGLVTPIWLPFDYSYFPVKQLVYLWQCYCCLVTYGAAGMISMAMLETMEHLVVKIQHLKMLVFVVMKEPNPQIRQKLFGFWMDYHVHIFTIAKAMNKSYRVSLSVIVLIAGALFGFIGHKIIEDAFTINSISLFCGWFSSLFILCVGGQNLINESLSVGTAIYNTKWYDLDIKFQKNLIPVIIRSQRPILMYAGPFAVLSLLLILGVLQTAYSYINLLNATS